MTLRLWRSVLVLITVGCVSGLMAQVRQVPPAGGAGGAGDALVADPLSQFAETTSAQLAGVLSNETGSGLSVFATSPTLTTPILSGAPNNGLVYAGTSDTLTAAAVDGLTYDPNDATYSVPTLWLGNSVGQNSMFTMGSRAGGGTLEVSRTADSNVRVYSRNTELLIGSNGVGLFTEINAVSGIKLSPAAGTDVSINNGAHLMTSGTAPTLTSGFGTGESCASCTDGGGKLTVGSGGDTVGVITFNRTWTTAPTCWVQDETTSNIMRPTTTTTTLTITGTMVASDVLAYGCAR